MFMIFLYCIVLYCKFLPARRSRLCYGNVAGWLDVRLGGCVTAGIVLKKTKRILKFFRPSGSPIIEAFGTPCTDTKFQGEPLHWGALNTGWGKLAIFTGYPRLSRKQCEIGQWLLLNVNRKSWVLD